MISIDIPQNKINKFMRNIEANILKEGGNIVFDATKYAKRRAKAYVDKFTFEGDLSKSIFQITNKKKGKGRVSVQGDSKVLNEALLNELGPTGGVYRHGEITLEMLPLDNMTASNKLKRWMIDKNKSKVTLGSSNTSWGKRNRFMYPAFKDTNNHIPQIIIRAIKRAINNSLI